MGQRFRLGVEHPHHRRRHRGGRVPATHRHCGTRRGNSPPPSDAVLRILFTVFFFFLNAAVVFFRVICSSVVLPSMVGLFFDLLLPVHGHSLHCFPLPIWNFLFLFGNEPWTAGEQTITTVDEVTDVSCVWCLLTTRLFQETLLSGTWRVLNNKTKTDLEVQLNCCGLLNVTSKQAQFEQDLRDCPAVSITFHFYPNFSRQGKQTHF